MAEATRPLTHRLAEVTAVAAVYYGVARLGLLLAIPPGYATPVWPASGIALASVLLLGYRACAGVWLGSFLANVTTSYAASSPIVSLAVPGEIALGAARAGTAGSTS